MTIYLRNTGLLHALLGIRTRENPFRASAPH